MSDHNGTLRTDSRGSGPSAHAPWRNALAFAAALGLLTAAGGCDGGGGSGGSGGGGSGGGGSGGGNTTSTPLIEECPLQDEAHVASVIVDPAGVVQYWLPVSVAGTVSSSGLDGPPSIECGGGMAWLVIDSDQGDQWIACFQAPSLVWSFAQGDAVTLEQTVNEHPIAPASSHTTLRRAGELVVHTEWTFYENELALPEGIMLTVGDMVCDSPEDPCKTQGYAVTLSKAPDNLAVMPGESATLGSLRVYLDRYWRQSPSSGCDGGDSHILISVTGSM